MRHTNRAAYCPTCGDRVLSVHHCRGIRPKSRQTDQLPTEPPTRPDPKLLRAIYEQARAEARAAAAAEQADQLQLVDLTFVVHVTSDPACQRHDPTLLDAHRGQGCHVCVPAPAGLR